MAMTFAKPRLMRWANNGISDHNRKELGIANERIENSQRMANGTMRKYYIADKKTYSTSWDMLPNKAQYTVDGLWGADEMEAFYLANPGGFNLELTFGNAPVQTVQVMFTHFDKTLQKRGKFDFYSVSVDMEQV